MKKSIIPTVIIMIAALMISAQSNSFYRDALKEGVANYRSGRYDQALERLRFAAFGLLDDSVRIRRVHIYSALSLFSLSRFEETRKEMKALAGDPARLSAKELGGNPEDEKMFRIMKRTLFSGKTVNVSPGILRSYEIVFDDAMEAAKAGHWEKVKSALKKMDDLVPEEPRAALLRGMRDFAAGDFAAACRELESGYGRMPAEFHDQFRFYLVRSCERVGRYGRALQVMAEIRNPGTREALAPVQDAIRQRRERDIRQLAGTFTRGLMAELVKKFPRDDSLAGEIWVQSLKKAASDPAAREDLIFAMSRFPDAADRHFYIQAGEYLARVKREKQSLRLLEKSPYAGDFSRENVSFMYTMGVILQKNGQRKKALEWMQRILRVQPEYEPAKIFMARTIRPDNKENTRRES